MASKQFALSAALASLFATRLATADVYISVEHDATYSLSESCGVPCSGSGAEPAGNACPKAGDVATADCHSHLLSYNGATCVAPVDAQCILIHDNVWGCAFSKMGYPSSSNIESVAAYDGDSTGWSTAYEMNDYPMEDTPSSVHYNTALDTPLDVNCDVLTETSSHQMGGAMDEGKYYGSTDSTMVDHQKSTKSEYEDTNHNNLLRTGSTDKPTAEIKKDSPTYIHDVTDMTNGDKTSTKTTAEDDMMNGEYTTATAVKETNVPLEGSDSMKSHTTGVAPHVETAMTGEYHHPPTAEEGKKMASYDTGKSSGEKTAEYAAITDGGYTTDMTGGYTTDTTVGDKSMESYIPSESETTPSGKYTSGVEHGITPVAVPADHMTYSSESYTEGYNGNKLSHEYVTRIPEYAGSYHGSEYASKKSTDMLTYQPPYHSQEETAYASTEKPCDLIVPEDETVHQPTYEHTTAPSTVEMPLEPVITLPTVTLTPAVLPTNTLSPATITSLCSDGGVNGVQVEALVRYNNLDIISTTAGNRDEQTWRSCCEQCLLNLVCVTFSFEELVSANVCVLTGSATGKTTELPNWQSGNVLNVRALVNV